MKKGQSAGAATDIKELVRCNRDKVQSITAGISPLFFALVNYDMVHEEKVCENIWHNKVLT